MTDCPNQQAAGNLLSTLTEREMALRGDSFEQAWRSTIKDFPGLLQICNWKGPLSNRTAKAFLDAHLVKMVAANEKLAWEALRRGQTGARTTNEGLLLCRAATTRKTVICNTAVTLNPLVEWDRFKDESPVEFAVGVLAATTHLLAHKNSSKQNLRPQPLNGSPAIQNRQSAVPDAIAAIASSLADRHQRALKNRTLQEEFGDEVPMIQGPYTFAQLIGAGEKLDVLYETHVRFLSEFYGWATYEAEAWIQKNEPYLWEAYEQHLQRKIDRRALGITASE